MQLKPVQALFLGALTILPYGYLITFLALLLPRLSAAIATDPREYNRLLALTFWLHSGAIILTLCLVAFYVAYAHRMRHVAVDERRRWARIVLFANIGVIPLFWYLHVWRPSRGAA